MPKASVRTSRDNSCVHALGLPGIATQCKVSAVASVSMEILGH